MLDSPRLLEDANCRDCFNVQGTTAGAISKRAGLATFATPAAALQSLIACEGTPVSALVGATPSSLVSVNAAGAVNVIKASGVSNGRWEGLLAPVMGSQGPLYMLNGVDNPQQWSGATSGTSTGDWVKATTSGYVDPPPAAGLKNGIPNGKYSTQVGNQMYITGVAAAPNRVYVSALSDPTTWDPTTVPDNAHRTGGATWFDLDANDGQVITAIGRVGPYVLVCKPRKSYVIISPGSAAVINGVGDTPNVRNLSDSIGCVADRSIATGAAGTYFLSEGRGVYVTNGSKLTPISDKILPILQAVGSQLSNACGFYFAGHYYLSIASQGAAPNDLTLDYDEILQSWWKHSFGSNELVAWHPSTVAQLYSAKSTAAIVDQCFAPNVYTDNGVPFTWAWKGPWQSPSFFRRRLYPSTYYRKRLRQIRLEGFGTVDYYLAKDFVATESLIRANCFPTTILNPSTFGGGGTFGGSGALGGTFGGGAPVGEAEVFSLGVARAFSQVFSATSNTQDEVLSYTLALTDRVDRWD